MNRFLVVYALLSAWVLFFCGAATSVHAQDGYSDRITNINEARRAVVRIESIGAFVPLGEMQTVLQEATGTGFIVEPEGIVVTNAHVVNGGEAFYIYLDGETSPRYATVLGVSECSDLAVLDIRGSGYPYLSWAETWPRIGQRVYAVGYPGGRYRMSRGMVSDMMMAADTAWASVDNVIYHSALIAPGNSGGPLLGMDGRVLGVNFATTPYDDAGVAISWEEAQPLVDLLSQGVDLDSIGINGEAFAVEDEEIFGIWVVSVDSDSPAAAVGVQPADILLSLEKIPVGMGGNLSSYCTVLRSHTPDDILHVTVVRVATEEVLCGQINGEPLFNCNDLVYAEDAAAAAGVEATGNGIVQPWAEATVQGTISVQGIAIHPDFWKWQLDLLVDGSRETYLGSGSAPVPSASDLLLLNTGMYPNGRHVLRLRVVRRDGNYDEYYTAINIQN